MLTALAAAVLFYNIYFHVVEEWPSPFKKATARSDNRIRSRITCSMGILFLCPTAPPKLPSHFPAIDKAIQESNVRPPLAKAHVRRFPLVIERMMMALCECSSYLLTYYY